MQNTNLEIAKVFYEMADILELENIRWKPAAYRMAAQTLESLKIDVKNIYKKEGEKGLDKLPAIGSGLTKKIVQYIKEGKIDTYEKLKKSLPSGLYEMMGVPGVGPKKAWLFYNKLGIKNINELKKAAQEHKLEGLPGFKERAEENILQAIATMKSDEQRILLEKAEKIAKDVIKKLKEIPEVKNAIGAGSLRRKKPTIRDIDIVIETTEPEKVVNSFIKMNFVKKVLGKGKEKATIINKQGIQIDIRLFNKDNFGSGLLYFTGSKQHNIWLRKIAIKKSYKLNEYGLFKGNKRIAGKTEKEIYDKLGLKYAEPEERT